MTSQRPCTRTTLALPWLLTGSLPIEERRQAREHLIRCPACREELARTRATLALFAQSLGAAEVRPVGRFGLSPAPEVGRSRAFRPLSWAAAAAILVSFGGVWAAHELGRDRTLELPAALQNSASTSALREPELIFQDGFEDGKLSGWRQPL